MKQIIFPSVLGLVVGAGMLAMGARDLTGGLASYSWPQVSGTILVSHGTPHPDAEYVNERVTVDIRYRFTVSGVDYQSRRVRFGFEGGGTTEANAEDWLERYPVGQTVDVHYRPSDPAQSTLVTGPSLSIWLLAAMGTTFFGGGLLLIVSALRSSASRRKRRRRRLPAGQRPPLSTLALTPSEMVVLAAARDADGAPIDDLTIVADDRGRKRTVLGSALKAALLAHMRAGTVTLSRGKVGTVFKSDAVLVTPTGKTATWPANTVESRLSFGPPGEPRDLSATIGEWISQASVDPFRRGLEQIWILLTLRGLVQVEETWGYRSYFLCPPREGEDWIAATRPGTDLLAEFRQEDPDLNDLLDARIRHAVARRKGQDAETSSDPWFEEADSDRQGQAGLSASLRQPRTNELGPGTAAILSLFIWVFATGPALQGQTHPWPAALVVLLVVGGYLVLWRRLIPDRPARKVVAHLLLLTPAALFALGMYPRAPILTIVGSTVLAALVLLNPIRRRVKASITSRVTSPPAAVRPEAPRRTDGGGADDAHAARIDDEVPAHDRSAAADASPPSGHVTVEITESNALPPCSEESSVHLQAIRERGPQIRRLYTRALIGIAGATTATAVIAALVGAVPGGNYTLADGKLWVDVDRGFPTGTVVCFGLTMIFVWGLAKAQQFQMSAGYRTNLQYLDAAPTKPLHAFARWKMEVETIRPFVLPVLCGMWAFSSLASIGRYARGPSSLQWVLVLVSLLIPVTAYWWMRRQRMTLERRYPGREPLNLLALRVFGSVDMDDYVGLIDRWHWIGTLQMLDGPDTAGGKLSDIMYFLTGRIDQAIIEDRSELDTALRGFDRRCDGQLRFSTHTMQCTDATWQVALDALLDRSHAIVMDLSGFSASHRGCAYEISRLVERVPLTRFILLVNDSTDLTLLQTVLDEAWARRGQHSVNVGVEHPVIRLFKIGGNKERAEHESTVDWKRRILNRIDRERLTGMLYDAALSGRTAEERADLNRPVYVEWGRAIASRRVRVVAMAGLALYLAVTLVSSAAFLTAERAGPDEPPPTLSR